MAHAEHLCIHTFSYVFLERANPLTQDCFYNTFCVYCYNAISAGFLSSASSIFFKNDHYKPRNSRSGGWLFFFITCSSPFWAYPTGRRHLEHMQMATLLWGVSSCHSLVQALIDLTFRRADLFDQTFAIAATNQLTKPHQIDLDLCHSVPQH